MSARRSPYHDRWASPVATLALTLVSATAVLAMSRVFVDWQYLRPMLAIVVSTHIVSWLLRIGRAPLWLAVPAEVIAIVALVGIVHFPSSTRFGLPTADTVEALRSDLRLVWQQFPTAVAPVPGVGNFSVVGGALLAVCAFVADVFAFRAGGRAEALVPTGVVVVFVSALSADRNRVIVTALWLATAIVTVAALRAEQRRNDASWMGPRPQHSFGTVAVGVLCAGCVSVGASQLAPRLPGADAAPLLDTRNRGGDVTQVVSPLVDIKSSLVNRSNSLFFTVSSTAPHYWRLTSLSVFDGRQWRPSDQELADANTYAPSAFPNTMLVEQQVVIASMRGKLLPAAAMPVSANGDDLRWAVGNQSLVVPGDLEERSVFNVTSAVPAPSADQLRAASTTNAPDGQALDLPGDLPIEVAALAREVTAGAPSTFDQLILLQNWFKSEFEYSLQVQRGHSNDAILDFIETRIGYCEQFAGTFSAMARTLGVPSRVVVGFTPGERGDNGEYRVFGRQAHAWSEVWFDGLGWIMFDPTPGRGSPDATSYTGQPAAQQEGPVDVPGTERGEAPTTTTPDVRPTTPGSVQVDGPDEIPTGPSGTTIPRLATAGSRTGGVGWGWIIVAGVLSALVAWCALAPRLAAARRRRSNQPAARIASEWQRTVERLERIGLHDRSGATPTELADAAARHGSVDRAAMWRLAEIVTAAAYAPGEPLGEAADEAEQLADHIGEWCRRSHTTSQRLRNRALLRV